MLNVLGRVFDPLTSCLTADALREEAVRFARRLGFTTMTAMVVVDSPQGVPQFSMVDNTPAGYLECFHDPDLFGLDPVMQHCKSWSTPIAWDRSTYLDAGQVDKWDVQASFGYCSGITFALHLPAGRHFAFGVDRDAQLPCSDVELLRLIGDLQLFATVAVEPALRILDQCTRLTERPQSLTRREAECLRWTMEGKTAWEVGRILGIAENTAVRHIHNASRKLGAANKRHAVVKALRLGLI